MATRKDWKFGIGLMIALFGPLAAENLRKQARTAEDPQWREFCKGAAKLVQEASDHPEDTMDLIEALYDSIFSSDE